MPELSQWREWAMQCALGLCEASTRLELRAFVSSRFRYYARKCGFLTHADDPAQLFVSPDDAWHLFESRLRLRQTRAGKVYKQWLLARAGEWTDCPLVESGVTLLVRDVVREHLRYEHMPQAFGSLEQPLPGMTGEPVSLRELLPGDADTALTVEQREIETLGASCSRDVYDRLSHRERVALLAREAGRSITDPVVLRTADCGKSELSRAYHKALDVVASTVRRRFAQDDREVCAAIACATLESVKLLLMHEIVWESDSAKSFNTV